MEKSVLDRQISMFERAKRPNNMATVNLLSVLQTAKYKPLADTCSQITDKEERRRYKLENVPVITVSGLFNGYRDEGHLMQHSGLICLDLDGVQDIDNLKAKVSTLPFVAYCGLSISGTGLFVIVPVPISTPAEHKQRYAALERYFILHLGITGTVDPQPKNVAAARYVSYDPAGYFNHSAALFDELSINNKSTKNLVKCNLYRDNKMAFLDYDRVWDMVDTVQQRQLDFAPDYADYLRVALSLAGGLGEAGREAFHAACQFSPQYNWADADKKYTEALRHGSGRVTLGTFFQYCKDYGLTAEKKEWPVYVPQKKITVPVAPTTPAYPPRWDNPEPLHDPITDRYRRENALQNLIYQGNQDAEAYYSGQIKAEEWFKRSDELQYLILAAGYTLKGYVQGVYNYQPKTIAA